VRWPPHATMQCLFGELLVAVALLEGEGGVVPEPGGNSFPERVPVGASMGEEQDRERVER
jgi:hypothetical protein